MVHLFTEADGFGKMGVNIVLPPGYQSCRLPLPFVVLLDAQNQWTNRGSWGGWHTDTIMHHLVSAHRLKPVVLVGLNSPGSRDRAYAPPPWGNAGKLADHIADSLIPNLRQRFNLARNRNWIGILGASFGGNFAVSAALFRPDTFGLCASFSAAPHAGEPLEAMVAKRQRLPMRKLYIDCGTLWAHDNPHGFGGDSTAWNLNLIKIAGARMPRSAFRGRVCTGHYHNEECWRKRVGPALRFMFGQ